MLDKAEKLGRTVLWFSLSLVAVLVIVVASRRNAMEAALHASEAKFADAMKAQEEKFTVLKIDSFGPAMQGLNVATATGQVWFTNASKRIGVVCVDGIAVNPNTKEKAKSLPSCQRVGAFEAVNIKMSFAGAELSAVCKNVSCDFIPKDYAEAGK